MQTLNNKTFQLTDTIIRLLFRVGVILAIILTGFLVQKQPAYAATNSDNNASVLSSPGPLNKSSPANAATNQPQKTTLSWRASSSATSYQYCVNTTATSCTTWSNTVSTSVTLSGLIQGTKYYWQVRARNNTGITYANGSSTAWWSFTIAPAPAPTRTKVPPTPTPTNTSLPPTPTLTNTSLPPTPSPTSTLVPIVNGNTCVNCYYIDSNSGSDDNLGTSEDNAWKTLRMIPATSFPPGSIVHFKKGSIWNDELYINSSGVEGNPITFTTYGNGEPPIFSYSKNESNWESAIFIHASWIVVDGLLINNTHDAGVYIASGSDHNIIRNVEIVNVGEGIAVHGQYNLITQNYIHNLHIINNTPGGEDDYGAIGIVLSNSNNEISYNRMIDCIDASYDFGVDGGAIEWYGIADDNYVHDNWASGNAGFLEVGGGSAKSTKVFNNVSINNGRFSIIHLTGEWASDVQDFRIENNTITENGEEKHGWVIFGFDGEPTPEILSLINNNVSVNNFDAVSNRDGFMHTDNVYYLSGQTELGFPLGLREQLILE